MYGPTSSPGVVPRKSTWGTTVPDPLRGPWYRVPSPLMSAAAWAITEFFP
jgi:hypothetical protein